MNIARYLKSSVEFIQEEHVYRLKFRSAGNYLPDGYKIVSLGRFNGGKDGSHGTISYNRPLTDNEKKESEVLEVVSAEDAVSRILENKSVVSELQKYADDGRTNIYNSSDNPFAYIIEDAMFRGRFYHEWRDVLPRLKDLLNSVVKSGQSSIPYSKIPVRVLRIIAESRMGIESIKNKQQLIDALTLIGYANGIDARTVESAERKLRNM